MMLLFIIVTIVARTTVVALDLQWRPEAIGNCSGYLCQTLTYHTGNVTECNDGDATININMSSSGDLVVTSFIPGLVNLSQVSTWDVINRLKLVMLHQLEGISEACSSMLPKWKTSLEIYTFRNISLLIDPVNDTNCGSDNQENANIRSGLTNVVISVEWKNITNMKLAWCPREAGSIDDINATATQSPVTPEKTKCLQCHFESIYDPTFNQLNLSFKIVVLEFINRLNLSFEIFERGIITNDWINNTTTDVSYVANHNKVLLIVLCSVLIPIIVICLLVAILVTVICRRGTLKCPTERMPTPGCEMRERTIRGSWGLGKTSYPGACDTLSHNSGGQYGEDVYSDDIFHIPVPASMNPNFEHGTDQIYCRFDRYVIGDECRSRQPPASRDENECNDTHESPSIEDSPHVALKLMKLVFQVSDAKGKTNTRQVFIHYHDDELEWVEDHLIPFLRDSLKMLVSSKEDLCPGSIPLEERIATISLSEYVILVLSDSFVKDPECRDVTTRAYSSSPQKVVPLGLRLTSNLESDPLFRSLVQTNGLIEWSEEGEKQGIFWQRLRERLSAPDEEQACEEERIQIVKECLTECANKCEVNETQTSGDTEGTRSRTRDRTTEVFVYYHDNESLWANDFLIPYLEETLMMVVQTKEHILPGSVTLEEILKNIQLRDMLIFVISNSFIDDQECRETITRSITIKPDRIVQVILDLEGGEVMHGSGMHRLILGMAHVDNRIHIRDPTERNFTQLGICLDRIVAKLEERLR